MKEYANKIEVVEEKISTNNSEEARIRLNYINAEYMKRLKVDKALLKQKNSTSLV